jgi:hypothetical protein
MSLHRSIIKIRVELQKSTIRKSGQNKFAGFSYYELADFLPTLNELMLKEGVNDVFTIHEGVASLTLIKDDESQTYKIPFINFDVPLNKSGQPSMQQIQYLGALNTYYKRYLYLNAFGITDGEFIDAMDSTQIYKSLSDEQVLDLIKLIEDTKSDKEKLLKFFNVKSLKEVDYEKCKAMLLKKIG